MKMYWSIKMNLITIHRFFPFNRLFKVLLGLSVLIQVIIISYNHISGYHVLHGFDYFLLRLLRGTFMSVFAGFLLAYPDLFIIRRLNRKTHWNRHPVKRIIYQLILAIVIAVIISLAVTLFFHWISPYREELAGVLINNAMIYAVVNILLMTILEGWIFFIENREAEQKARNLREELSQIKFEALKSQINPHFMFNSLNVLSGLIERDTQKAQLFIDEFSYIYRYVLETIEQPVARLEKELDFLRSYLFLQQIRYGKSLMYSINIPGEMFEMVLPPLSLQITTENAIKHNVVDKDKPLRIDIYCENRQVIVKNNLQLKISAVASTGLGIKNLKRRYSFISSEAPEFYVNTNYYIAKLPLIDIDNDEDERNNY